MTPTQRLALENPKARTAPATVTAHLAGGFLLDRTIFHAADKRYHHPQPHDRGHALADGHKLKIHKVGWDRGALVHRTEGPLPTVGAKAQLHLDGKRRDLNARAHAALHLLLAALAEQRAEHLAPAEVVGGGECKCLVRAREAPEGLARKLDARVRQLVDQRLAIEAVWMPREDAARHLTPQHVPLDEVAPGEPTLRIVRIGTSALPCDAPLPDNTRLVGDVRVTALAARDGVRVRARVAREA